MDQNELIRLLATLCGGGLAGALVNEMLRRWNSRLLKIPLLVKRNKIVDDIASGYTLARIINSSNGKDLEAVSNVREYGFTLRNNTLVNLRDSELEFEFPCEDVVASYGRPSLSNTPLVEVNGHGKVSPGHRAYRFKIPHLPTDSELDFYFRSVGAPSDTFRVSIHNADRVIVEVASPDDLWAQRRVSPFRFSLVLGIVMVLLVVLRFGSTPTPHVEFLESDQCLLSFESKGDSFIPRFVGYLPPPEWIYPELAVWRVDYLIQNVGTHTCTLDIPDLQVKGDLAPGGEIHRSHAGRIQPSRSDIEVRFGNDHQKVNAWRIVQPRSPSQK